LQGRLYYDGESGEERQGIVRIQQFKPNFTRLSWNVTKTGKFPGYANKKRILILLESKGTIVDT